MAIPPWTPKFGSPGNCIIIGPGIYFLDRIVQNFGANNFGFHPKVDILDFWVLFLKKVFPKIGKLATLGPMGPHGAHGAHGAHGPMGPMGPHGAPWGHMGPIFQFLEKLFFRKSTQKSKMSTLGVKTKVVRTEILHILVPIPSRGDP